MSSKNWTPQKWRFCVWNSNKNNYFLCIRPILPMSGHELADFACKITWNNSYLHVLLFIFLKQLWSVFGINTLVQENFSFLVHKSTRWPPIPLNRHNFQMLIDIFFSVIWLVETKSFCVRMCIFWIIIDKAWRINCHI